MKHVVKGTVLAGALMLFTAAFGMTAYADKAIKTVGIKVTGTVNAGSPIGDEKLEIKPQGSRYTVNHYEVLNEGPSWRETDVPDIKIHLQAEDGYYFRVNAASQVHIDGAEYVTATREDNAYALIVEVKLPSLALQASSINEANLTNTTASWTESLGAGSYETKWKRDGKTIGVVRTVQGTSHDVSSFFTKAGVYSFQVRGVSAQNPDFRGAWTESNDIVVTEEMASAQRAKNAAAESAGTWEANGDKWSFRLPDGGYVKSAWRKINNEWYVFDANGHMITGWFKDGDKWYYLDESGKMLYNRVTPDGYQLDINGVWVAPLAKAQ